MMITRKYNSAIDSGFPYSKMDILFLVIGFGLAGFSVICIIASMILYFKAPYMDQGDKNLSEFKSIVHMDARVPKRAPSNFSQIPRNIVQSSPSQDYKYERK
ncbi:hypothetical protein WKW50_23590 [Ochrobactrum sp. GPK 3]|uniref:hypothetical protein n=1 Tax=Brucella sp. 22210 TaxID=3453892 RepID=UPI0031385EE2